jgi:hypothetical protein
LGSTRAVLVRRFGLAPRGLETRNDESYRTQSALCVLRQRPHLAVRQPFSPAADSLFGVPKNFHNSRSRNSGAAIFHRAHNQNQASCTTREKPLRDVREHKAAKLPIAIRYLRNRNYRVVRRRLPRSANSAENLWFGAPRKQLSRINSDMTDWTKFLEQIATDLCSSLRARGVRPETASRSFANVIVTMFRLDEKTKAQITERFLPVFADGLCERQN